eukprot:1156274-Pelagomonas_calceolata.AAC.1
MLNENVSPAADQPESWAVGQPPLIRGFVREHTLADRRPHASLWLAKTYVVSASMYASQVWGTGFMHAGKEFSSALKTLHLNFLKGTLGVKRNTTYWAVLRECGLQPLQSYWFRAAVKLYNNMLGTNSSTLRHVMQADLKLQSKDNKCWTAHADLRYRLQGAWRKAESVDPGGNNNKLATYQAWCSCNQTQDEAHVLFNCTDAHRPATSRSAKRPGSRSPPIVTNVIYNIGSLFPTHTLESATVNA